MSKHSFNIARGARKQQPEGDASLGLTEAFAPIGAGDAPGQRGAADGDTSLGLTEAFRARRGIPAGAHARRLQVPRRHLGRLFPIGGKP